MRGHLRGIVVVVSVLLIVPLGTSAPAGALPAIRHVWVIQLENESASSATKDSGYVGSTLPTLGETLTQYVAIGHNSLDNYIAEISGQAPNTTTQDDCQTYVNVVPGNVVDGQASGTGCVYPSSVQTVAGQMAANGLAWKGYMEDMGNDPSRDGTDANGDCGHPSLGNDDPTQDATASDQYATRHDPFVYFHSIIDRAAQCDNVVPLSHLRADLGSDAITPAFSWITPNLCDDGHDQPCAGKDTAGHSSGGFTGIDDFLNQYVPMITASPAFASGLLIVTFDEADTSDSTACCGETPGPGASQPGQDGPGGGRVDTVLVSPFVKPGSSDGTPYNHYSMLRTVEDLFGLDHLGEAANPAEASFGDDVFPRGVPFALPSTSPGANTTPSGFNGGGGGGGGGGSTVVIIVAVAVVVVLGGGSVVAVRRRRHRDRDRAAS